MGLLGCVLLAAVLFVLTVLVLPRYQPRLRARTAAFRHVEPWIASAVWGTGLVLMFLALGAYWQDLPEPVQALAAPAVAPSPLAAAPAAQPAAVKGSAKPAPAKTAKPVAQKPPSPAPPPAAKPTPSPKTRRPGMRVCDWRCSSITGYCPTGRCDSPSRSRWRGGAMSGEPPQWQWASPTTHGRWPSS